MLPRPSLIALCLSSAVYNPEASPIRFIFTGYFDSAHHLHCFPQARPVFYLNYCNSSLALPLAPPIHFPQGSGVILTQKQDHVTPLFQFPNDFLSYSEGLLYLVSSWPFLQSNLILFSFLHSTFQWQQLFFNLSNMTYSFLAQDLCTIPSLWNDLFSALGITGLFKSQQ